VIYTSLYIPPTHVLLIHHHTLVRWLKIWIHPKDILHSYIQHEVQWWPFKQRRGCSDGSAHRAARMPRNLSAMFVLVDVILSPAGSRVCELVSMPIPTLSEWIEPGARTLDIAVGGSGAESVKANGVAPPVKQPYCYRSCGNGPCTYCCGSDYTPTICWNTMDKCTKKCHLPWSPPSRTGAAETNWSSLSSKCVI
jgi:hypothetical protein